MYDTINERKSETSLMHVCRYTMLYLATYTYSIYSRLFEIVLLNAGPSRS